jgi:FkbM family methyltransferase
LFEPNNQHNQLLKIAGSEFHNMILGKEDNDVKFFSHGGTGDSMYPEFDESLKVRSEFRTARCHKVDSLVKDHQNFPPPDFLKLDVQGAEIDVLNGATETIKLVKVILIECPIVNYNLGSPNIHEYLEFMFRNDFIPYFITEIHRLQQIVTQIDIAFVAKKQFESKIKSLSDVGFWESTKVKYRETTQCE